MWAQTPAGGGRFVQDESVGTVAGVWAIRVHSVDVFPDRSMRVNLVFAFRAESTGEIAFGDLTQIQLVADRSDERVHAQGQVEGPIMQLYPNRRGFRITRQDSVRIGFRFPAFQDSPRTVRFVLYQAAMQWGLTPLPDFVIRNIALFAK